MANQPSNEEILNQFIDETVELAGFADMPAEFLGDYKDKLLITLLKKIGVRLSGMLTDKQVESLADFTQKNPNPKPEEIFKFYELYIDDIPEKIIQTMKDFQLDFLKNSAALMQGLR